MPAKVVVIGSLNMDLVTRAPRLPKGGETLIGESFATVSGGCLLYTSDVADE